MRRNELLDLTFLKFAGVKISGGQVELLATSLDLPIDAIDRFAQWGRRLRKEGGGVWSYTDRGARHHLEAKIWWGTEHRFAGSSASAKLI